jgi:hypothetical protein
MIGKGRSGVFPSYARKDGEQFASKLRQRLRKKAPDISIKQDRMVLEGGVGWWKQFGEAIDSVKFRVLVMTPSSMQSETVRKECQCPDRRLRSTKVRAGGVDPGSVAVVVPCPRQRLFAIRFPNGRAPAAARTAGGRSAIHAVAGDEAGRVHFFSLEL